MLKFLKTSFASCFGSCLFVILSVVIFFAFIITFCASNNEESSAKSDKKILLINTQFPIRETLEQNPIDFLVNSLKNKNYNKEISIFELCKSIENAANDKEICSIVIVGDFINANFSSIINLKNSLDIFKKSNKKIYIYLNYISTNQYLLSGSTNNTIINPMGNLELKGISINSVFFGDFLKNNGIKVEPIICGKYKSALEPFTSNKMSNENFEQLSMYVNDYWSYIKNQIINDKNLNQNEFDELLDLLYIDTDVLQKKSLVNSVMYIDEFEKFITKENFDIDNKLNTISVLDYNLQMRKKSYSKIPLSAKNISIKKDEIALLSLEGEITQNQYNNQNISANQTLKILEEIYKNKNIKALVVRINTPGGSAVASEIIARQLELIKEKIPVVISMSDTCASGGYWIASNANYIFADPSTLTGSIGVFGLSFNIKNLANEYGINFETIKSTQFASIGSFDKDMTKQEKEILQKQVSSVYDKFIQKVSKGRNIPLEKTKEIAKGRIYSGKEALNINLVDNLGNINDAINKAAELANISQNNYKVKLIPDRIDFKEAIFSTQTYNYDKFVSSFSKINIFNNKYNLIDTKNLINIKEKYLNDKKGIYTRLLFINQEDIKKQTIGF